MLYVIYGDNIKKTRDKLHELLDVLQKKQPDAEIHRLDSTSWKSSFFEELLQSQGLFLSKYIVVVDKLIEDKEISPIVVSRLDELKNSQHMWIVIEEKVTAGDLKKIKEKADKFLEYSDTDTTLKNKKREENNWFYFAEMCANKNKVEAWREFDRARKADVSPEELCGILWWQFKCLLLVNNSKKTGLSPFVENKAKVALKHWNTKELEDASEEIISMYHKAHRGEADLMDEMEKFILSAR